MSVWLRARPFSLFDCKISPSYESSKSTDTHTQHTQSATSRRREQETTKHSELAHKYFHGGTKWPPEATNEWKCINLIFLLVCAPPLGPWRVARININIFRTANKEKKRESRDGHLIRAPHLHMNWSKHTRTQHKTSVALINQFAWIQTNYSKDGRHPQVPPGGLGVLKLFFFGIFQGFVNWN